MARKSSGKEDVSLYSILGSESWEDSTGLLCYYRHIKMKCFSGLGRMGHINMQAWKAGAVSSDGLHAEL